MDFLTAVSTIGFPIVSFFLMYQMCNKTISENTETIKEMKSTLTEIKGYIIGAK